MDIDIYKQPVIIAIPDHTSNWINKCFAFNVASKSLWIFFKKMLHREGITNRFWHSNLLKQIFPAPL
jgi:hypothetical protein